MRLLTAFLIFAAFSLKAESRLRRSIAASKNSALLNSTHSVAVFKPYRHEVGKKRSKRFIGLISRSIAHGITGCGYYPSICRMRDEIRNEFIPKARQLDHFLSSYHKTGVEIRDTLESMRGKLVEIRDLVSRAVQDLVQIAKVNLVFSSLEEQAAKLQLEGLVANLEGMDRSISQTIGDIIYIGGSVVAIAAAVANPVMIIPYLIMEGIFIGMDVERERLERDSIRENYYEIESKLHYSFNRNLDNAINSGKIVSESRKLRDSAHEMLSKLADFFAMVRQTFPDLVPEMENGPHGLLFLFLNIFEDLHVSMLMNTNELIKQKAGLNFRNFNYDVFLDILEGLAIEKKSILREQRWVDSDYDYLTQKLIPSITNAFESSVPEEIRGMNWQDLLSAAQIIARGMKNRLTVDLIAPMVEINGVGPRQIFAIMAKLFPDYNCYEIHPLRNLDHPINGVIFPANMYNAIKLGAHLKSISAIQNVVKRTFHLDISRSNLIYILAAVLKDQTHFDGENLAKVRTCTV